MQKLPLESKIMMTERRIQEYYEHFDGKVYVQFSGGKDSTVLLHIVRRLYPDVPAVFCDTGLEFPEIREFVKSVDNVIWLKPEMNYKSVIKQYGYPIITKRVADAIHFGSKPGTSRWNMLHGNAPVRADGRKSEFDYQKYAYLLDAPFKVSAKCCDIMKKNPLKKYSKESGRVPIIGTMAQGAELEKVSGLKKDVTWFLEKSQAADHYPSGQKMIYYNTYKHTTFRIALFTETSFLLGGSCYDRSRTNRMYVLWFWMPSGKGTEQISDDERNAS